MSTNSVNSNRVYTEQLVQSEIIQQKLVVNVIVTRAKYAKKYCTWEHSIIGCKSDKLRWMSFKFMKTPANNGVIAAY